MKTAGSNKSLSFLMSYALVKTQNYYLKHAA